MTCDRWKASWAPSWSACASRGELTDTVLRKSELACVGFRRHAIATACLALAGRVTAPRSPTPAHLTPAADGAASDRGRRVSVAFVARVPLRGRDALPRLGALRPGALPRSHCLSIPTSRRLFQWSGTNCACACAKCWKSLREHATLEYDVNRSGTPRASRCLSACATT